MRSPSGDLAPVPLDEIDQFLELLVGIPIRIVGSSIALATAPIEHQSECALGIRRGEQQAHRSAFGNRVERRPNGADRVDHRTNIVHPLLKGRRAARRNRIRDRAALVEQDDPTERRKALIERRVDRIFPEQLQVADPPRDGDEIERSVPENLKRDVCPVAGDRILNLGAAHHGLAV